MFVNDKIFVLYITVGNTKTVKIFDSIDDLRKDVSSLFFSQPFVFRLLDAFKEVMGGAACDLRTCAMIISKVCD